MRPTRSVLALLVLVGVAQAAEAQAPRTRAQIAAGPRDVREVFLAVPRPAPAEHRVLLRHVAPRLGTYQRRLSELESATAEGKLQLDRRNGYLRMTVPVPDEPEVDIVITYFTRANGERLVVMQLNGFDMESGYSMTEDYLWTLSGGRFTSREIDDVLPHLEFGDFWDEPRPADLEKDFFIRLGAFVVDWPRRGTVATFRLRRPRLPAGEAWADEIAGLFERWTYNAVQLVWDRQRGRFTTGERGISHGEEEHDHHH